MGNSQTKEARSSLSPSLRHRSLSDQSHSPYHGGDGSRSHRSSRPDLSFLGIGGSGERESAAHEHRRETKQDREARRLERERVARLKERERSMKEEHVDGGYLVTQGVYVGVEDFNKAVVRQLMIERRLAPFWRGLNDFNESWTEHQLMAAARGMPIPPPDQIPPELQYTLPSQGADSGTQSPEKSTQFLTVPISGRSPSMNSDTSHPPAVSPALSLPSPSSPIASGTSGSPLFRSRAKTFAALTNSKNNPTAEMAPREIMLRHDPFVNGQPIEAYLYKDASECPICFLYYPPYLNRTRCCDQPICSECFVQIKRPDPHPPEHAEQDQNTSPENDPNGDRGDIEQESQLVSEPSACPFCVQPEFGVTYSPPTFRRGLSYASPADLHSGLPVSPVSSNSSLGSAPAANGSAPSTGRRRATSLSANDPSVITTDKIRPDWAQKLANARAHAARRSAAATALHTAAYLMNSGGTESRGLGRRGVLRRTGASSSGTQTPANRPTGGSQALHALAFLSERRGTGEQQSNETGTLAPRGSSRRSRIDDLEEMMMMEAIRMSLASEEDRRRKEEKEIRKEAKKKEKEAKKAEKAMRKNGIYSNSQTNSALFGSGTFSRVDSSSSSVLGEDQSSGNKGKGVDRTAPAAGVSGVSAAESAETGLSNMQSGNQNDVDPLHSTISPSPTEPSRPSHLRHMSSASSTSSSFLESGAGEQLAAGAQPSESNSALEPMFNFRSLAAVIGDEEKVEAAEHVEDTVQQQSSAPKPTCPTEERKEKPTTEAQISDSNNVAPVESDPPQNTVTGMAPKEINPHLVEVSREATV